MSRTISAGKGRVDIEPSERCRLRIDRTTKIIATTTENPTPENIHSLFTAT
jgi:hypothetical protein